MSKMNNHTAGWVKLFADIILLGFVVWVIIDLIRCGNTIPAWNVLIHIVTASICIGVSVIIWIKDKVGQIIPLVVFALLCCAVAFYTHYGYGETSVTKFTVEVFAVFFSGLSIIYVVQTLRLQKKQLEDSNAIDQRSYDAEVMKIIDKFFSPELAECRGICGGLRDKLMYDKENTEQALRFAFERQIRDDYHSNKEWMRFKDTQEYKDYAAFTRFVRYFDLITNYDLSSRTAHAIHFYYVWWRSFIVEVKDIFVDVYASIPPNDRQLSFLPNWVEMTERMDTQLSKHNLPLR